MSCDNSIWPEGGDDPSACCEQIEAWMDEIKEDDPETIPVAVHVTCDSYKEAQAEAAAATGSSVRDHLFDKIAIRHVFFVDGMKKDV